MTFDINDLPEDGAICRTSDGWSVGYVWSDEEGAFYYEDGRGASIEAAQADARAQEKRNKAQEVALSYTRVSGPLSVFGINATVLGREPKTAAEHIAAAKILIRSL